MPLIRSSPARCFLAFEAYVRKLSAEMLGPRAYVQATWIAGADEAFLTFRDTSGPLGVPFKTPDGRLCFYMWQRLVAEADPGGFRLSTREYVYRIQEGPDRKADKALIRFEYNVDPHPLGYARHHVQMAGRLKSEALGGHMDLDKLHLPTGWVTIEEVFRFLIADLKFLPACGEKWEKVLDDGYRRFFEEFTSKRYKPQLISN